MLRSQGEIFVACVASVPVRAKCYVSRASEVSGRAKIGAGEKKGKPAGRGIQLLLNHKLNLVLTGCNLFMVPFLRYSVRYNSPITSMNIFSREKFTLNSL